MIKKSIVLAATLLTALPLLAQADILTRQLEVGSRGTDVSAVQTFLANDRTLYPQGLVTGYYGFLTKSAVSNFQVRNGISPVGRVGPATLPVLNAQMAGGMSSTDVDAPFISNIAINLNGSATSVSFTTNALSKAVVYYSTVPLTTYERENSVDVSGNTAYTDMTLRTSHVVSVPNLISNTRYYYLVYVTDRAGNVSVTVPGTFQTAN